MTRTQAYAALLRLYPKSFRREYEEQMLQAFADLSRDSLQSPARFWAAVLCDVCRSVVREHVDVWACGMGWIGFNWTLACSLGALMSGAAIWTFMLLFTLLFPPQVDSNGVILNLASNLPVGVYGALIGLVIGGAQAAVLRQHVRRTGFWIMATAIALGAGFPSALALANWIGGRLIGSVAGLALLGALVGLVQSLVFKRQVGSVARWIAWNTLAIPAGILTGVLCEAFLRASPSTWSGLLLAFAVYPAAIGLVIGALTVHPLTTVLSDRGHH